MSEEKPVRLVPGELNIRESVGCQASIEIKVSPLAWMRVVNWSQEFGYKYSTPKFRISLDPTTGRTRIIAWTYTPEGGIISKPLSDFLDKPKEKPV